MARGFLVLISFFTRIPIGRKIEYNEDNFKEALTLFNLIGVIIGILMSLTYYAGEVFNNNYIRGLLLTICYIVLTGGIHLDGSSDTADGLFSGRTGDKIFDIMSDSHIGAFGTLSLIIIVLSQFVLLSNVNIYICFIMPVIGRTATILSCYNKKYAKKSHGMGTAFIESVNNKVLFGNIIILFIFCIIDSSRVVISLSVFVTLILATIISDWIERKIGGMTGDTCGFVTESTQIIFMLIYLFIEGIIK